MIKIKNVKINLATLVSAVFGFALGVATIIFGIIVFDNSTGSYADYASFGADFYTYMYEAGRYAANNLVRVAGILREAFGYLLISLGGFEIIFFVSRFLKELFEDIQIGVPAKAAPVAPEAAAPVANICPNCGNECLKEAIICVNCGASLINNGAAPAAPVEEAPVAPVEEAPAEEAPAAL